MMNLLTVPLFGRVRSVQVCAVCAFVVAAPSLAQDYTITEIQVPSSVEDAADLAFAGANDLFILRPGSNAMTMAVYDGTSLSVVSWSDEPTPPRERQLVATCTSMDPQQQTFCFECDTGGGGTDSFIYRPMTLATRLDHSAGTLIVGGHGGRLDLYDTNMNLWYVCDGDVGGLPGELLNEYNVAPDSSGTFVLNYETSGVLPSAGALIGGLNLSSGLASSRKGSGTGGGGPYLGIDWSVDVAVETGLTSLGTESATGDFNEDGWDDLVTLHPWEDAASFMPFDHLSDVPGIPGGAVFGTPTTLATVPNPTAAVAADVDGDGHLDLVVIGEMDRAFVHLGDGSGGFDLKVIPVALPGIPTMLERIDVDVDGQHELVFAAADYLLIASRNESGGFEFESIPVNGEIRAVATNPFDGPAKLAVIDVNVINVVAKIEVLGGSKNTEQDVPPGLDDAMALAAGESHVAALTPEGEVVCWGWNGFGQCDVPDDLDQVVAIACGANFTLVLEVDGDVRGWGDMDDYGPPNPPGDLGRAVEIAAGRNHAVALEEDGTVRCWGVDDGGQCDVPSFEFLYQIDAGKIHSIGLDGYFEAVCWGSNGYGQCDVPYGQTYSKVAVGGFHSIGLKSNGTVLCWGLNTDNQCDVPPGETFTEVVGGWYHTIGLRPDGTAVCWGRNAFNQCNVPPGETFTQVDGGYNFSIGLRPNGTVAEWGSWTGNPINETFIQIAAGGQHRIGLRSNGTAFCWGSNSNGECDVPPGETFVRVDAGDDHSIGIRPDGTAVCWGRNPFGQCNVPEGESFYQIAGGQYHSIGLRLDGIPVGWGWNGYGQRDMGLGRSVGIGAGDEFTCAIGAENGYVRCWGAMYNSLGVFVDVAGGGSHVAGIEHDGGLKCWGNNNEGQAPGSGGEYLLDVDAGDRNTVAREWDGTLLCWGSNQYGQCDIPVNMLPVKALACSNYATIVATREETAEQSVRLFEFEVESTLPGDINNDGQVNGADLGLMLAAWGPCADPSNCPADLNGDGHVDGADLGLLLSAWS